MNERQQLLPEPWGISWRDARPSFWVQPYEADVLRGVWRLRSNGVENRCFAILLVSTSPHFVFVQPLAQFHTNGATGGGNALDVREVRLVRRLMPVGERLSREVRLHLQEPFQLRADTELLESFCDSHAKTMEHRRIDPAPPEPPSPPLTK